MHYSVIPSLNQKKKAAIINYFNGKELLVTLRFQVDGTEYLIERGQKPSVMRFVRFNSDGSEEDLAQGVRATQTHTLRLQ